MSKRQSLAQIALRSPDLCARLPTWCLFFNMPQISKNRVLSLPFHLIKWHCHYPVAQSNTLIIKLESLLFNVQMLIKSFVIPIYEKGFRSIGFCQSFSLPHSPKGSIISLLGCCSDHWRCGLHWISCFQQISSSQKSQWML